MLGSPSKVEQGHEQDAPGGYPEHCEWHPLPPWQPGGVVVIGPEDDRQHEADPEHEGRHLPPFGKAVNQPTRNPIGNPFGGGNWQRQHGLG